VVVSTLEVVVVGTTVGTTTGATDALLVEASAGAWETMDFTAAGTTEGSTRTGAAVDVVWGVKVETGTGATYTDEDEEASVRRVVGEGVEDLIGSKNWAAIGVALVCVVVDVVGGINPEETQIVSVIPTVSKTVFQSVTQTTSRFS
jgi:hypothetical protein